MTAYFGLVYQRNKYDGQSGLATFEFDSKKVAFFRFCGRFLINSFLSLGIVLIIYIAEIFQKQHGLLENYFTYYFIPSTVGFFLLFSFADHICMYLGLYNSTRAGFYDARLSVYSSASNYQTEVPQHNSVNQLTSQL